VTHANTAFTMPCALIKRVWPASALVYRDILPCAVEVHRRAKVRTLFRSTFARVCEPKRRETGADLCARV